MDISNFFTVQAPREEQKISGGNTSGSSVMPADVSFLDFILARLAEENPETPKPEEHKLPSSDNPVLESDINIAELIADNPEIREQIEAWSLDPNMKLSEALALNQKALDDALHIAIAAVHGIDYLLTWNCRHIDNAEIKPTLRAICYAQGYRCPEIATPLELMGVDDND